MSAAFVLAGGGVGKYHDSRKAIARPEASDPGIDSPVPGRHRRSNAESRYTPGNRAYRNARELRMHTGRCDTVGMFCLRRAKSGGESGYSSALAVHDRIRELEPELLESIWRGFHLHRFGEPPPGEPPYTPLRIPVFSERDGVTTVILIGGYAWMAADEFDAPFSDRDREALATFERLAAYPEFRVNFQLERGEAALFNNCAVLHNRTALEDHDEPHLMRLWLMDWDGRPTVEGVRYHKGEGGIPRQKDKQPYCADRNPAMDEARGE